MVANKRRFPWWLVGIGLCVAGMVMNEGYAHADELDDSFFDEELEEDL